jgi:hypothetical protein
VVRELRRAFVTSALVLTLSGRAVADSIVTTITPDNIAKHDLELEIDCPGADGNYRFSFTAPSTLPSVWQTRDYRNDETGSEIRGGTEIPTHVGSAGRRDWSLQVRPEDVAGTYVVIPTGGARLGADALGVDLGSFVGLCDESDPAYLGSWGLEGVDPESGVRVYARIAALAGDRDGYRFEPDGSLEVRGPTWFGTPPFTFFNSSGSWEEDEKHALRLSYEVAREPRELRLVILSVSADEMRCRLEEIP